MFFNLRFNFHFLLIPLIGVFFTACYNGNSDSIEIGKDIYTNYSNELIKIKPILDNAIEDSCQVFRINLSPKTDLFSLEAQIDEVYDSIKFRELTDQEELEIQRLRPRSKVTTIMYLKEVYIGFRLHQANHSTLMGVFLVHVIDTSKFNFCFPKLKDYSSDMDENQANWKYKINDHWFIVCGSLIYNSPEKVCSYLKEN